MTEFPCTWWSYTGAYHGEGQRDPMMVRLDGSEERPKSQLPVGALYAAEVSPDGRDLREEWYKGRLGFDGHSIFCKLPSGFHWCIDGFCSNCTRRGEAHKCWVRHGTIGEELHVDKSGNTCTAGGGSVIDDGWHGFLHHGRLKPC